MPQDAPKPPLNEALKAFGERMRERRQELGISQEEAADRIGHHWSAYGRLERGQRSMHFETILKIAEGLDIDPGELMRGIKAPSEDTDGGEN